MLSISLHLIRCELFWAIFRPFDPKKIIQGLHIAVNFVAQNLHINLSKWRDIMNKTDQDEGFIGPIKPLMSMSYRDYLRMINTGLGLPRFPRQKAPFIKRDEDYLFPPVDYKLN